MQAAARSLNTTWFRFSNKRNKAMPSSDVSVIGTRNFTPTQNQIQRVQDFYRWSGYKKLPDTVIFVHSKDFPATARAFDAQTRTALTHAGRSYVNAAILNSKDTTGENNLEWTLAHEAAHLNSPGMPAIQEKQDKVYDDEADALLRQWNGKSGQAYRTLMAQQRKLPGMFGTVQSIPNSSLQFVPLSAMTGK